MCALRGRQPGGRLKSRLFCVTSFRTRVSTPCAVMRLSTVYLLLTDGFANAGVIYGQTPEKPVESRNLRLERLHLTLPKIEYPMLCWSIKMLEISLSNITTQHRIVEVLSSYQDNAQHPTVSYSVLGIGAQMLKYRPNINSKASSQSTVLHLRWFVCI